MSRFAAAVVADDLTGAMDTGNVFAARGHRTLVTLRADAPVPDDVRVLVADTESRYDSPDAAARAVSGALDGRAADADVVYKKVDSTLRGNLVAEVDAATDAAGADLALVAPAFPRNGRLTAEGYHLVDGELVTRTPAGRDPDKPVTAARLPALFADSAYPVRRVSVGDVAAGADAVASALHDVIADADADARTDAAGAGTGADAPRPVVAAADAVTDSHLDHLAAGAAAADLSVVFVGSAGLAAHVSLPGDADADPASALGSDPAAGRAVLGVAGSTAPETLAGVAGVDAARTVPLDLETAVADPAAAAADAARACAERLGDGGAALLASARDDADTDRALRAGRDRGLDERTVRERVATALALAVARVWDESPPDGLFLTGGAVAVGVLRELDAAGVSLSGAAVEAGVPLGRVRGGRADGTPVVTKAGGFGSEGTIANCLARLGGRDE